MRVSKGKKVGTVVLIAVFMLIICAVLVGSRFLTEFFRIMNNEDMKLSQAKTNIAKLVGELDEEADELQRQANVKRQITARALSEKDFSGWNGQACAFKDGYIVERIGDSIMLYEGIPYIHVSKMDPKDYPQVDGEQLEKYKAIGDIYYNTETGGWYSPSATSIDGNYCYLEFSNLEEQKGYTERLVEVIEVIRALEKAYNVRVVIKNNGKDTNLYWSDMLSEYKNLPELGINVEEGTSDSGLFFLLDDFYSWSTDPVGDSFTLVILSPLLGGLETLLLQVLLVLAIILVGYIIFAFWAFSVFKFVRTERLTLNQQKHYTPKRVRTVAFAFGIISAAVVFLAGLYGCTLIGLYHANEECNTTLETLFERINAGDERLAGFKKTYDNNIISELSYTTDLMEEYPELINKEFLQDVSTIMGADYLVVYDSDGNQHLTNSDLRGLLIGGAGDSSGSFIKLQNGVPSVINEPDPADPYGFYMASYGVPISFESNKNYGVLAAYVPPKVRDSLKIVTQTELIDLLAPGTGMIFTVNPETKEVIHSSVPEIIGRNVIDLGMEEKAVKDHFMDFFRLSNIPFYGISQNRGGVLYYVAVLQETIMFGTGAFGLVAAGAYFLFFLFLMLFLLFGYKEKNIVWQDYGEEFDDSGETVILPTGEEKKTVDVSQRWVLMQRFRGNKTPWAKTKMLAEILALIVIALGVIYFVMSGKENLASGSIFGYVIYGEWTKGFNIFALTAILLLFCLVFFINFVLELVGFTLNKFLDTKGETIFRLAFALARYILIIIFFYYGFDYLGFDTRAVIASLGLLSFALSLGMKDLVTDLIAGITIVFEGEYQVGDIVEIGGFRGSVVEVGVRSTKLMGRGGNIKIISNRDVKNVLNMTHLNSWCAVEVTVSREESMSRMEDILDKALPEIGEKISQIISGPFYKGVLAFGKGGLTISIIAECKEKDYHEVQRKLTGELNRVFEENQVKF